MSGIYDLTLAPGTSQNIGALGEYLKVISAPQGRVRVRLDGGDSFALVEGQGFRKRDGETFRDVSVSNLAAYTQTVQVFIGDARFEDSRVTGSVQIVDGGKARTMLAQAFIAYAAQTAGAGQVPVLQLLNPAAATTRAIVKALRMSSATAGSIAMGRHDPVLPSGPFTTFNKLSSGAVSNLVMYRDLPLATGPGTTFESFSVGAGLVVQITFQEPIVLLPGAGLVVWHSVTGSSLQVGAEFSEESNNT